MGALIGTVVPENLRKQAYEELGAYRDLKSAIGQVDTVMDDMMKNNTLANRITSPVQSRIAAQQAEARLMPIVKKIVGEKMSDADARILIQPYIIGVLGNKQTGDKSKADLKKALAGQAGGRTPILTESLKPYGMSFGLEEETAPTKTVNGKRYRRGPNGEAIEVP